MQAKVKKEQAPLDNHQILSLGIEDLRLAPGSLRGLISIHALYTFPDPGAALRNMYQWLEPGGNAVLVDAGRIVNVLDWQIAIGWRMIRKHGLRKTLQIMREGKEVSRQNAKIRQMQRNGLFWMHSHEEFCQAVEDAGFEILKNQICFRGVSDFVVARKLK